jgi:membrane protein required for colicin V production
MKEGILLIFCLTTFSLSIPPPAMSLIPWLDIMIVAPIAWGGYMGWKNGVLDDLVHALHFLIAFAISFKILSVVFALLETYIFTFSSSSVAGVNSFAAMLFASSVGATFILLSTLGKYLKTEIEYDFPGAWDNISGSIFGSLRSILILSFMLWFLQAFGQFRPEMQQKSILFKYVEGVSYTIVGVKDAREMSCAIREFSNLPR